MSKQSLPAISSDPEQSDTVRGKRGVVAASLLPSIK